MIALQKLWKCFLFHLKSSFSSQDIQIFMFPSFYLFIPVDHCFREWSKINLNVYDVINYLNKKLITHFIWYLEKERRYYIETLSIINYWIRIAFIEKSCRKCAPKASPRHHLVLVNDPKQPLHARIFLKNKVFWKRIIKNLWKDQL